MIDKYADVEAEVCFSVNTDRMFRMRKLHRPSLRKFTNEEWRKVKKRIGLGDVAKRSYDFLLRERVWHVCMHTAAHRYTGAELKSAMHATLRESSAWKFYHLQFSSASSKTTSYCRAFSSDKLTYNPHCIARHIS